MYFMKTSDVGDTQVVSSTRMAWQGGECGAVRLASVLFDSFLQLAHLMNRKLFGYKPQPLDHTLGVMDNSSFVINTMKVENCIDELRPSSTAGPGP